MACNATGGGEAAAALAAMAAAAAPLPGKCWGLHRPCMCYDRQARGWWTMCAPIVRELLLACWNVSLEKMYMPCMPTSCRRYGRRTHPGVSTAHAGHAERRDGVTAERAAAAG